MSIKWVPLESNPEVMTQFMHNLGVPKKWQLVDVYGFDPELLAATPQPVLAMILLYPYSQQAEVDHKKAEEERIKKDGQVVAKGIYHMKQLVSNACGTVAIIHCIANNLDKIKLEDGPFKDFLNKTKDLSFEERGEELMKCETISENHHESAQEGQTEAPSLDEKVEHHFIAFVHVDGHLYELDGNKPFPINHGPTTADSVLESGAAVCLQYMKRNPDDVHFSTFALVDHLD